MREIITLVSSFPGKTGHISFILQIQGGYRGGVSVTKKIDASRITVFKFYFEALHVSLEICVSRITKNIFFKSRFSVNEMI